MNEFSNKGVAEFLWLIKQPKLGMNQRINNIYVKHHELHNINNQSNSKYSGNNFYFQLFILRKFGQSENLIIFSTQAQT